MAGVRRFGDFDRTTVDGDGLAVDEGVGDLLVSGLYNPPEGLPRDVHAHRRFLLIQTLQVCQAYRLQFINRQLDALEHS
jgi:hypothetical protein